MKTQFFIIIFPSILAHRTPPPALALKVLAENKDLKMLYDMKKVPLDPLKMTAGISFVNVGTNAIVGVGKNHALKKYDQFALNTSWIQYYPYEIFVTKIMKKSICYCC